MIKGDIKRILDIPEDPGESLKIETRVDDDRGETRSG